MDALIFEMEKLLASGKEGCDIQDIIGESAGKNIDDLLVEADQLISETLPYFQTNSNSNKIKVSKNIERMKSDNVINTVQPKTQNNNIKRVVFNLKSNSESVEIPEKQSKKSDVNGKLTTNIYTVDEERKKIHNCSSSLRNHTTHDFKIPEVNFMKTQVSSTMLENHNRLKIICDKHDKLANMEIKEQTSKLKIEEELNYYKLKNNELEKDLMKKEQEIRNWEKRYQHLNHYCESFLKRNIEDTLKSYDYQLNELIERNITRETQLHTIISNLLEEIDQSHLHYRIKLSEKNKQIRTYLDQMELILDKVHKYRNYSSKRYQ